jgi:hypothetical protein
MVGRENFKIAIGLKEAKRSIFLGGTQSRHTEMESDLSHSSPFPAQLFFGKSHLQTTLCKSNNYLDAMFL